MKSLIIELPACMRSRSLGAVARHWASAEGHFWASPGADIFLPPGFTFGAREMYWRNVYLRTGLTMPTSGWVIDLGRPARQ